MKAKKIIVVVTNDLNQDQRMHRICASMQSSGYDVLLVGREKINSKPLLSQSFKQHRFKCFFQNGIAFYTEFNLRLLVFLIRFSFIGLYSVDLDTIVPMSIVSRLKKRPLIHDAHEYFVEVPELQNSNFKKAIWASVAKLFIPLACLRITVNKELASILSEKYKCDFKVVRSVPELRLNEKIIKGGAPQIILYQGVLNIGRGLEEAIRAVSSLDSDVELHIAGEGDLSKELRQLKDIVDFNDKVKFLGWKNPDELKEITRKAFLGLNLLDSDSLNYKYSLANKFFDYLHAEIPSLNMNFPVYLRYCRNENVGVCIKSLSEIEIVEQINQLINDPKKYTEMVASCKSAKLKYNWGIESLYLNKLIKSVLQ